MSFLQVINYYYYLWDRTQGVTPEKLLVGLPPCMQTNICQNMYGSMLKEAFVGKDVQLDQETEGSFRLISTHIKPQLFLKESVVCRFVKFQIVLKNCLLC